MLGPLGFWEIMFILLLALLIFGPRRLPEIGRTLGRAMGELRRATSDFTSALDTEVSLGDDPPSVRPGSPASRRSMPSASQSTSRSPSSPGDDVGTGDTPEQSSEPPEPSTPA